MFKAKSRPQTLAQYRSDWGECKGSNKSTPSGSESCSGKSGNSMNSGSRSVYSHVGVNQHLSGISGVTIRKELIMLGYMTARDTIAQGFTHHANYYGIPLWVTPDDDFMVAVKWYPLDYLMTLFIAIEGMMREARYPHEEPVFQFTLGEAIKL